MYSVPPRPHTSPLDPRSQAERQSALRSTTDLVSTPAPSPLKYCLLLLLIPLIAIPLFIALGQSDFFLRHGASVWVQANDAIFTMNHRQCDVVIYGDSTAMTGINPEVVEEQTGLYTCNIAVTNAVLAVTDNLTLDHFLAHNGRPRVLLVQLSPEDLQAEHHTWHRTIYAEGLLELLRHGSPAVARHTLLTHPQEAIAFAGYAAGYSAFYGLKQIWFHLTHVRPAEDRVIVRNGFFTPPAPARTFCDPAPALAAKDRTSAFSRSLVATYRQQFATRSGVVLVNVAPIPSCDQNLAAYTSELNGVTNNALLPLPIHLFNDDRHYTALGSTIVSHLVADELLNVEGQPFNPALLDSGDLAANRSAPRSSTQTTASLKHIAAPR